MIPEQSLLGQLTDYPREYAPQVLFAIPRAPSREAYSSIAGISCGMDWWQVFELSWLNEDGLPQVAMARLAIPADSPCIVESKSLKLYFNSLNFSYFADPNQLTSTIQHDLSDCVGAPVGVTLFAVDDACSLPLEPAPGLLLDRVLDGQTLSAQADIDPEPLKWARPGHAIHDPAPQLQRFHSHLLRSNCPVTNQPDWGTVAIDIEAPEIDQAGLLRYILSFRQHNGFHEQCVERIFADLTQAFAPVTLLVRAWYTRRGGIDINPCRVSSIDRLPQPSRLNRQ